MSDIKLLEQIKTYDKPHCYQYQKRLDTLQEDLLKYGWPQVDLGIEWQDGWNKGDKIFWEKIPNDIEDRLRSYSKKMYEDSEKIEVKPKGKYAFILGRDKRETKKLRKKFLELNKIYDYPSH